MSVIDYKNAFKSGRKEYESCVARGIYPYLNVLEDILSNVVVEYQVSLGVCQVPLRQIVGTNARSRSTAFARNFMPLLEEGTEFSYKWSALSDAHVSEGIRDSIKCYEYMNRFYVVEGNKRVSVLKYFGAVSINAEVTRLVPRYDPEDPVSRIYYEFLDFYKVTQVNYLWVTKEGSFARLLEETGYETDAWDEDTKREFFSCFTRFDKAYTEAGGKNLRRISTGDAFLKYLSVFGYQGLKTKLHAEIAAEIHKLWDEYVTMEKPQPVGLVTDPAKAVEEEKPNLLERFLGAPNPNRHLKIGFIHDKDKETSSWTYGHELGRMYLESVFEDQIETVVYDNCYKREQTPEEQMLEMVDQGVEVIFATTPRLDQACIAVAVKCPQVHVLNCALNSSSPHIKSYYGRLYEPKFLSGIIAGSMTKTNRIGYVADYPVSGMLANINAFARGARMVNPEAKVYLEWSTVADANPVQRMIEHGVDLINNQDMITPAYSNRAFGLYRLNEDGKPENISMSVWDWGRFYERIVRSILNGAWSRSETETGKAVNYWWGLSAKVVDIVYSKNLPSDTKWLVEYLKRNICRGDLDPFSGVIRDQQGMVRCEEDGFLTIEDIVNMDWLIDNVIGEVPEVWEFKKEAQPLLKQEGMTLNKSEKIEEIPDVDELEEI